MICCQSQHHTHCVLCWVCCQLVTINICCNKGDTVSYTAGTAIEGHIHWKKSILIRKTIIFSSQRLPRSQDLSLRWWRSNLLPFYIYWVALNCGTISGPRKDHKVSEGLITQGNKNHWHIISLFPATAAYDYILWFLQAKVCSAYSQTI